MTRPALIVDGLSIFHACAGPAARLTNGYTYSFVVSLTSVVKKFGPSGIFVCWDRDSKMRRDLHPGYKADRPSSMNEAKRKYLEDVKRFLKVVGADQLWAEGHEADDVGAMLANTIESAILLSNDKDWLQLVRPGVSIFQKSRDEGLKAKKKLITHENFPQVTGYAGPEEFVKALCAMGDGVDRIDGIFGIGDATIKAYLMGVKIAGATKEKLDRFFSGEELFVRNYQLINLRDTRSIPELQTELGEFDEGAVRTLLEELGFASMLKNFPEWVRPYREAVVS